MRRHIMGAMVLMFGLAMAAGFGGEAQAFAGSVVVEGPKAGIEQVHFKKKHRHHHHKHHKRGKFKKGGFVIKFGNTFKPRYGHGRGFQPVHRNCHGVSKDGYFNGRYALIGGTKCYNRFGRGYIVEGSRHVIHYY